MSVVREDRYIMANVERNNNKWWDIQLLDDGRVICRWGRVGEVGDSLEKQFASMPRAEVFYENKCREKEKKGYQALRTVSLSGTVTTTKNHKESLSEIATRQIQTSSPETLALVHYLTQANIHNILSSTTMHYDTSKGTFSTPLGVVTKDAITEARRLLADISGYVARQDLDNPALLPHLNHYLMLVPQDIGRSRPSARTLYPTLDTIQRQNDILDALDASVQSMLLGSTSASSADQDIVPEVERVFEVKIHDVTDGNTIDSIRKKYKTTQKPMHGSAVLDVKRVYHVDLVAMNRDFENDGAKLDNIWDLWHGSKKGNLLSIMAKGFVIPPSNASHCTGRMYGNGTYFSDQSTKSLNYAWGYWDGKQEDNCFMFICQVAMGNYYTPPYAMSNLPKPGYDSTFAEAGKSGVINNEMIVYRTSLIRPVFLVEFSRGGR